MDLFEGGFYEGVQFQDLRCRAAEQRQNIEKALEQIESHSAVVLRIQETVLKQVNRYRHSTIIGNSGNLTKMRVYYLFKI